MNATEPKALPKSLHTVTAIVQVARHRLESGTMPSPTNANAIHEAMDILGYGFAPDPHGLAAKALKVLGA
jgi:hypothetical protein